MSPTVSICCLSYNHAPYIRKCLEGFMMQECNFNFEVLIHDDASTDGTPDIIKEIQEQYPDIIKPIFQEENQYSKGIKPTFKYNFPRAKGKYIAMCEGDDYWTDPLKLQKQVDFLEMNLNYSGSFTNSVVITEGSEIEKEFVRSENRTYSFKNVLEAGGGFFPTATLIFRKSSQPIPSFLSKFRSGDFVLILIIALNGLIYYHIEKTSVYRMHKDGVFSSIRNDWEIRKRILIDNIELLKAINEYSHFNYNKEIKLQLSLLAKKSLLYKKNEILNLKSLPLLKLLTLKDFASLVYRLIK